MYFVDVGMEFKVLFGWFWGNFISFYDFKYSYWSILYLNNLICVLYISYIVYVFIFDIK